MLVQIEAPDLIISLVNIKEFVRELSNDNDLALTDNISTATQEVENYTQRQVGTATFELYLDYLEESIFLPKNPIQEILTIEYLDENSAYQTLDTDTYYLYESMGIGVINFTSFPKYIEHKKAIKITFKCGYLKIPTPILSWIKIRVSTLNEFREQKVLGASVSEVGSFKLDTFLSDYRIGNRS